MLPKRIRTQRKENAASSTAISHQSQAPLFFLEDRSQRIDLPPAESADGASRMFVTLTSIEAQATRKALDRIEGYEVFVKWFANFLQWPKWEHERCLNDYKTMHAQLVSLP